MKRYIYTLLLLFISLFISAQKDSITLDKLNFGKEGYFKTYQDFLKGNIVAGKYKGAGLQGKRFFVKFNVAGKNITLKNADIWGYWCKDGLVRINKRDSIGYKVISVGDVFYYCPWYIYPVKNSATNKVEYAGKPQPHEMVSSSLNSQMLGQLDLFYQGVRRATEVIAGDPNIYKFEQCGHGAFENTPVKDLDKITAGWYLGDCYQAKLNPRIWLNPVGTGVAYVEEMTK